MEVEVHIFHAGITDATRFNLHCRAQAVGSGTSREVHEGSVAITAQPESLTNVPPLSPLAFTFASKPAKIGLLFVAIASRKESTSSTEKELGRCEGTLDTGSTSQHSQILLFSQQIPGTKIEKFTGKLKYAVHHTSVSGADYSSLPKDEAKRTCVSVLPSESPFISVVFHCAYTTNNPNRQLIGVARIGDRNDIRVGTLLEKGNSSPEQFHHFPFLKPVKLVCQDFDCLELHVVDNKNGTILFSLSQALNRLVPFRPIHCNYDREYFPNSAKDRMLTEGTDGEVPSVSVSVTYTPSESEFSRFEGFEVVVCKVSIPDAMQHCKDVVMGIQLVQKQKMETPLESLKPPFQSYTKKGKATYSMAHDYHVTVLQYQGKNITTAIKSYLLFSCSPKKLGENYLVFHVFGSSGTHLWWNTDNCLSTQLEISEEKLTQLQGKGIASMPWKASCNDPSQLCVSGIMRWKSKQTPFITESDLRQALGTLVQPPSTNIPQQTSSSISPKTDPSSQQEPLAKSFDPLSIQQTLEGRVTPASEPEHRDPDILTQLAELESGLQHIAREDQILREENQRLQGENEQLLLQMAELKAPVTVSPQNQSDLQLLSTSDLILGIGSLQQSLEAEERAHEMCQKRIQSLQNELSSKRNMETLYVELQEVHMAQQKQVQCLSDKVTKYRKCADVCRKQEQLISQLESLFARQTEGHSLTKDDAISLLSKENAQLRSLLQQYHISRDHGQQQVAALVDKDHTIHSLKSQLSHLVRHCQYLESHATRSDEKQEVDTQLFELEQKLVVAEAKLSAQTTQLQKNAEQWMAEKARYEIQLADFRSRLDTLIRSGQQALSITQGMPGANPDANHDSESKTHQKASHMQRYFSRKTNTKDFSF